MPVIRCPSSSVAFALLGRHLYFRGDDREAAAWLRRRDGFMRVSCRAAVLVQGQNTRATGLGASLGVSGSFGEIERRLFGAIIRHAAFGSFQG
jgi:hypothetical protein